MLPPIGRLMKTVKTVPRCMPPTRPPYAYQMPRKVVQGRRGQHARCAGSTRSRIPSKIGVDCPDTVDESDDESDDGESDDDGSDDDGSDDEEAGRRQAMTH